MARVKVTGPLLEQALRRGEDLQRTSNHRSSDPPFDSDIEDSTFIEIHVGWKAFTAFALVVVQTIITLLVNYQVI